VTVNVLAEDLDAAGPTNFAIVNETDPRGKPLLCGIDFCAYVAPGSEAAIAIKALVAAAKRQLQCLADALRSVSGDKKKRASPNTAIAVTVPTFRCYQLEALGHAISLVETEDAATRTAMHRIFRMPNAPLIRSECALPWASEAHPAATGKPINPHTGCGARPSWWKGGPESRTILVRGLYEYAHYMHDHFDDNGWGCAYRSLQTCVSWYRMQHYCKKEVPSIPDIQSLLKRIDEAHKDLKVGSRQWIGTVEGMYCLQEHVGLDCKMLYCSDSADMMSQLPQVFQHFESEGTPVMMGAGQKAFTLVGLCYDAASGEAGFLIVDPHYTGADDLKTILAKGWVGWKNSEFFAKNADGSFINLCLPMVPRGAEWI